MLFLASLSLLMFLSVSFWMFVGAVRSWRSSSIATVSTLVLGFLGCLGGAGALWMLPVVVRLMRAG